MRIREWYKSCMYLRIDKEAFPVEPVMHSISRMLASRKQEQRLSRSNEVTYFLDSSTI
jgi:hypothetical protein